ncbi:MAG: GNAT family N-acetyltransferase [Candidatus Eisenbacteria bacterium]
MSITVREARPADAPAVVRLILELAATIGEDSPITEDYAAKYLSSPGSTVLLAETRGQAVGLLSYSVRPDLYHSAGSCLIEELIVQESARRQGVGSLLMTKLLSRLAASDCAEVSVATMSSNTEAIEFYRRHGLVDDAVFLEQHFNR